MTDKYTIETTTDGAICISTICNGKLFTRRYYYYEIGEALDSFESELIKQTKVIE